MNDEARHSTNDNTPPPPRAAFTQGVGTVFQFTGVTLFLVAMFACCSSSLLSKDFATRTELADVGWPFLSGQMAVTLAVTCAVFFGMALAGVGLGLQATGRRAPWLAVAVTAIGSAFWTVQTVFGISAMGSILYTLICGVAAAIFLALLGLSAASWREMRRDPPPPGHEILPADYKVPYSHLHADPPEVRLAAELEQRRQRLAVQQKELEMLEEKLKRKLDGHQDV